MMPSLVPAIVVGKIEKNKRRYPWAQFVIDGMDRDALPALAGAEFNHSGAE